MKFVHIAGTNGKGSVAEYISNMIIQAGMKCGCFTSPHLISPTERIRVNGKNVGEHELRDLLEEVNHKGLATNDSLFAAYTAAALLWFERQDVDWAVMETGLGGRLDPTNRIQSDIVVLTSIDYDHTNLLGGRLDKIAQEKCGIIKLGIPVISAKQHPDVEQVIRKQSSELGAPLHIIDDPLILSSSRSGYLFRYGDGEYSISMIGEKQPENSAIAIKVASIIGIDGQAIKAALKKTTLNARTQYIKGDPPMLIDGAHNPAATNMLVRTLERCFPTIDKVLLFACMEDKDKLAMIKTLGKHFKNVIVTQADDQRGLDPELLKNQFVEYTDCKVERNIDCAFERAKQIAKSQHLMLVVCGSLYLAGTILKRIEK